MTPAELVFCIGLPLLALAAAIAVVLSERDSATAHSGVEACVDYERHHYAQVYTRVKEGSL